MSWVVGAVEGDGGGRVEEKPFMAQRTIRFSLEALERMRSPKNWTLWRWLD